MRLRVLRWCLVCVVFTCGRTAGQSAQYVFRVYFNDKTGSPQLTNPLVFLSQRALDRRSAQSIPLDNTDRPVSPAYINNVVALTGGKLHVTSRWLNTCVLLLTDSSKIGTITGLSYIDSVKYISYYSTGLHKPSRSTDDKFSSEKSIVLSQPQTTGSSSYYGGAYDQTKLVNGDYLHDHGYKGEGMLIAVFDQGFTNINTGPEFDSMRNSGRLVDQYNFANATTNVLANIPPYTSTHGTEAISTIAANLPGTFVGAAPHASFAVYVTEVMGSEQYVEMDNLLAAAERSDSLGADIISISLGYNDFSGPASPPLVYADIDGKTTVAAKAANIATSKGILFVASAGNDGIGWYYILTPGDADSAMTIGNVSNSGTPASNSGHGPNASGHPKPDVCLQGQPATVMDGTGTTKLDIGTSFSTPQLAGWAACLWQSAGKNTKPFQLRDAINKSASLYPSHFDQPGYGVPDFEKAYQLLGVKDTPQVPDENNWVSVTPNPFVQQLDVKLYNAENGSVKFSITDMSGRLVVSLEKEMMHGYQQISLVVPGISQGIYFLKVISGNRQKVLKLVKR